MSRHEPTVFIVDDDESIRHALSWLFTTVHMQTRTFASAQAFLDGYTPISPACLLLDLRMPEMSGLRLQEEIKKRNISVPIIFLTSFGDVGAAVQAMKMGAVDFLEKPFNNQVLLDVVQRVLVEHSRHEANPAGAQQPDSPHLAKLSAREQDVFRKLVEGKINKVVASELGVTIKTVEFHRANILKKLGVHTIADLIALTK